MISKRSLKGSEFADMTSTNRPLPKPDEDSDEFWRFCSLHELRMQRCNTCGYFRFRPSVICPRCLSTEASWEQLSGIAQIHSFVVIHQQMVVGYDEVPYVIALVDLDEGPRMTTRIVDCEPNDLSIGLQVQVTFEDCTDDISLPVFVPFKSRV